MKIITVVMLNYRRAANIPSILEAMDSQTVKPAIWLWNNSGHAIGDARIEREVVADANWFCWPRWFLASYATTKYVLMIDDDLMPKSDRFLEMAVETIERESVAETIVGSEGVALGTDANYRPNGHSGGTDWRETIHFKNVTKDVRVDIVKGRCVVLRTEALRRLPLFSVDRDVCDDIMVSGLLGLGRRRPHLVSAALGAALEDIVDIESGVALSSNPNWRQIRQLASARYFRGEAATRVQT